MAANQPLSGTLAGARPTGTSAGLPAPKTPATAGLSSTRAEFLTRLVVGPDVLDVGCTDHCVRPTSPYWLHGVLAKRFAVAGVDLSEDNVAQLRALGFDDLHVGNAEDFHLRRQFDTVIAGELIEHLSNPGRFLECAKAHLKPGGRIVISTPNPFCLMNWLYALAHFPKTCENSQHSLWLCPSTLAELGGRAGLRIRECYLIFDYEKPTRASLYQVFWQLIKVLRFVLPARLTRTTLVAVMEPR